MIRNLQRDPITLRVVNRKINGIEVAAQVAQYMGLQDIDDGRDAPRVVLNLIVTSYELGPNNALGDPSRAQALAPYSVQLIADNDTLIDLATGDLFAKAQGQTREDFVAWADADPRAFVAQYDAFAQQRNEDKINIKELILHHMTAADSLDFNRFQPE